MRSNEKIGRRSALERLTTASLAVLGGPSLLRRSADAAETSATRRSVAGVVTVYRERSHADVLLTKILQGWEHNGGPGPNLRLASLYVDQPRDGDLGHVLAAKHGVPLMPTIEASITLGQDRVAVDGVLSIGEHGDYPRNDKGQQLYPRRRFFESITNAFAKFDRVVPVFSDKHLGPVWSDARWMYDRARELSVPFMAGSSLPVTFREPDVGIPMGSEIEDVVGVGYGGIEAYGFHALEFLQVFVERRRGAENGVAWVECLSAEAMWQAVDGGRVSQDLLNAALAVVPHDPRVDPRKPRGNDVGLFLFEYRDGLRAAVFMLSGFARGMSVAVKLKGNSRPIACQAVLRDSPAYPHFAYLLKAIEGMVHTGRPSYPVERTLLTSGLLDRLLTSRATGQQRLDTPELSLAYEPVDYPHAPHVVLS